MSSPVRLPLLLSGLLLTSAAWGQTAPDPNSSGYGDLVELFEEWRQFQRPQFDDGVPDYTEAAMREQRRVRCFFPALANE